LTALTAAESGLADLRRIVEGASGRLKPGGWLALETGIAHHAALLGLLADAGFAGGESVTDLTGRDRFVFARRG
jgi:release factor glutamine methyltransferase